MVKVGYFYLFVFQNNSVTVPVLLMKLLVLTTPLLSVLSKQVEIPVCPVLDGTNYIDNRDTWNQDPEGRPEGFTERRICEQGELSLSTIKINNEYHSITVNQEEIYRADTNPDDEVIELSGARKAPFVPIENQPISTCPDRNINLEAKEFSTSWVENGVHVSQKYCQQGTYEVISIDHDGEPYLRWANGEPNKVQNYPIVYDNIRPPQYNKPVKTSYRQPARNDYRQPVNVNARPVKKVETYPAEQFQRESYECPDRNSLDNWYTNVQWYYKGQDYHEIKTCVQGNNKKEVHYVNQRVAKTFWNGVQV